VVEEWCWRHQYDAKEDGGIRTNNPNAETLLVLCMRPHVQHCCQVRLTFGDCQHHTMMPSLVCNFSKATTLAENYDHRQ